jgi:nucleotide-binding universal stress UspA family protein
MSDTRAVTQSEGDAGTGRERSSERVFANVLCAVNGTHGSYSAVRQAAVLAGPEGHATLLAVTAVTGSGAYRNAAISATRAEHILERATQMARDADVQCSTAIDPAGPPPRIILERAAGHDLLALGAPEGSSLFGIVHEGVASAALGSLVTPLLLARSTDTSERHPFARRIVVASDGQEGSDEVVDLAARIGREQGAHVTLLCAVGVESNAHPHRTQEQARRLAASLDGDSELLVEVGDAAAAIVHAAERAQASLVVMGTRRLEGLRSMGSVSRKVVADAGCSVLLIPPESLRD